MLAFYALAAVTAAYGDDASPAGKAAVRDLVDVGAAFCAASYREDGNFDPDAILRPRGFALPGERIAGKSGSVETIDLAWRRPDGSLTVMVHVVSGQISKCAVKSPAKVWERMVPAMPAFAKAARIPLVQHKAFKEIWRGGGMEATARTDYGGTILILGPYRP